MATVCVVLRRAMNADQARPYFSHPSQLKCGLDPNDLHDNGIEYRARHGVCLAFHQSFWPTVWMVHIGVIPSAWGKADAPCKELLGEFLVEKNAERVIAWIPESNRACQALAERIGFQIDGVLPLESGHITMNGWRA